MAALPTATVTFLFTALLQRLGDRQYAKVLEEHRRLLREAFAEGPAHLSAAGAAMLPQVRSFVETHWAAIGAIAQALLREHRLSGPQDPGDRRPECHERQHEIGRHGPMKQHVLRGALAAGILWAIARPVLAPHCEWSELSRLLLRRR